MCEHMCRELVSWLVDAHTLSFLFSSRIHLYNFPLLYIIIHVCCLTLHSSPFSLFPFCPHILISLFLLAVSHHLIAMFLCSCVIAELFLDGRPMFTLSQLLEYCNGGRESFEATLKKINDKLIRVS